MVPQAELQSYYGKPIINKPTWKAADIAGYLFLGGLAGAGSAVAGGAQITGRPGLARVTKTASAAAAGLSLAALVHDLGRRGRFLNMLRTFKVTSPMSVGSWLLATYAPACAVAALSDLTGMATALGTGATATAAVLGPGVACYTAALITNTAVPAWHDGYRYMPFVFASSAASAAAGLGLVGAPLTDTGPVRRLAILAGGAEVVTASLMEKRMGPSGEAYRLGKADRHNRMGKALTLAGMVSAGVLAGRSRVASALAGAALLTASALTRFAIFEAGVASAEDPRYTVVPQRRRLAAQSDPSS